MPPKKITRKRSAEQQPDDTDAPNKKPSQSEPSVLPATTDSNAVPATGRFQFPPVVGTAAPSASFGRTPGSGIGIGASGFPVIGSGSELTSSEGPPPIPGDSGCAVVPSLGSSSSKGISLQDYGNEAEDLELTIARRQLNIATMLLNRGCKRSARALELALRDSMFTNFAMDLVSAGCPTDTQTLIAAVESRNFEVASQMLNSNCVLTSKVLDAAIENVRDIFEDKCWIEFVLKLIEEKKCPAPKPVLELAIERIGSKISSALIEEGLVSVNAVDLGVSPQ